MTYHEMRDMELLSSIHLVVEDLELIIQRVPHGWIFVYHKILTPINVVMGTQFVREHEDCVYRKE